MKQKLFVFEDLITHFIFMFFFSPLIKSKLRGKQKIIGELISDLVFWLQGKV